MSASYAAISCRSMRRSAVYPKGSKGVPRRKRKRRSRPKAESIHGPKLRFRGRPEASVPPSMGGARWKRRDRTSVKPASMAARVVSA